METTFKIVLDKRRPKKNNLYPLRIRVYQGDDYKTYSLGIDLRESDWNVQTQQVKTSHPSHKLYNVKIATLKAKVQKSIFMNEDEEEIISPEELINQIARNKKNSRQRNQIYLLMGRNLLQSWKRKDVLATILFIPVPSTN